MKLFNQHKDKVVKIRIVSAPAGAWYEDLVGTDIESTGYNHYNQRNEWYVNIEGYEQEIEHNDARYILPGDIAQWSTVVIKNRVEPGYYIGVLCGKYDIFGIDLKVSPVGYGSSLVRPEEIIQVLDEGNCFDESESWKIAKFYNEWKLKKYIVCPYCKSSFNFYSLTVDKETLKCSACLKDEEEPGSGIRLNEKVFKAVDLSDEDIRKNNAQVLYQEFKRYFTINTGRLDPDYKGYISESAPEDLMEIGAEVKYHYDLLGEDRVNELRDLFKKCLVNCLTILKKRKADK